MKSVCVKKVRLKGTLTKKLPEVHAKHLSHQSCEEHKSTIFQSPESSLKCKNLGICVSLIKDVAEKTYFYILCNT